MLRQAGLMAGLALCVVLAACGGDDDTDAKPISAAASTALLAQIPTLGQEYPARLARFVDTEEGQDYGLAVTVAEDGNVVAYLCDGETLGRAFSGAIEDGADSATLKAVKGDGTVDLKLSDDAPSSATVKAGDVSEEFTLASTKIGGYFREEVEGVTRGWVVSDTLELRGVQTADEAGGKSKATTSAVSSPPLSSEDQQLVGAQENPNAPPQTTAFLKARRCSRLQGQYNSAFDSIDSPDLTNPQTVAGVNAANLALARGKSLGCGWTGSAEFLNI